MAERIGRASSGHAVQLPAQTLKRVAVVVDWIGAGKQLARLSEQDYHAAHNQPSSSDVDIARRDGHTLGA